MPYQPANYPEQYLDMDIYTLLRQLSDDASLQHVIDSAAAVMDMPLLMINNYHHCIAFSNGIYAPDDNIQAAIAGNSDLSPLLSGFRIDELYCADSQGLGYLYCITTAELLTPKKKELLPFLTWILFSLYNKTLGQDFLLRSEESRMLKHLVNDKTHMDIMSTRRIAQHIADTYAAPWQILVTYSLSEDVILKLSRQIPHALRTPYICSVSDKYFVFLLHETSFDDRELMQRTLKDLKLRTGVSYPFSEPDRIDCYVHQAMAALQEASRIEAPFGLVFYQDYLLADLMYHAPQGVSPYNLQHPALRKLRSTAPHLFRTLQIYIQENCSTARASEVLHLHKNSVNYQLKHISDELGYDVTAEESVAALRYAFAIDQFLTVHND